MRKFKFKFSAVFYVLFGIIYALALTALIWNGIRLFTAVAGEIELNVYNAISLGLSILLPILFIILITAAIISSAYNISGGKLTVNFGFLKDSFKISDIESIIKNVRYSTLYISFKDGSGYKIVIDENEFEDFSSEIIKLNRNVVYGETDEEKKKK